MEDIKNLHAAVIRLQSERDRACRTSTDARTKAAASMNDVDRDASLAADRAYQRLVAEHNAVDAQLHTALRKEARA